MVHVLLAGIMLVNLMVQPLYTFIRKHIQTPLLGFLLLVLVSVR